jgi:hypothetical protein
MEIVPVGAEAFDRADVGASDYLRAVDTDVNVVLRLDPRLATTAMMATSKSAFIPGGFSRAKGPRTCRFSNRPSSNS